MKNKRWVSLLPSLLLVSSLLLARTTEPDNEPGKQRLPGATADMSTAPRVNVDRPKPFFALSERHARVHGLAPFQALVDAAPAGSVLRPPPGNYAGPVELTKPLTIEGAGKVTIDAGDKGTVISLQTDGVTLRGLHLTGSGDSHDTDDSCLDVRGHRNTIENLVIDNCLNGIDLKQANDNLIKNNKVKSKPFSLGLRGDGLRLWYSHRNLIEGNEVTDSRDMVAWYSNDNVYRHNLGMRSRYSIHFMFAKNNLVEDNRFIDNAVGIYFMYGDGGTVRHNLISHATGATGMAIGFKEASNILIDNNEIVYCAIGIGSDMSPFEPDSKIWVKNNRFAFNGIAIQLLSELGGNIMTDNIFEGNLTNAVQAGRGNTGLNEWRGNYWDDYQGFDRNHDGMGDTPYELYSYADQIWIELPAARFFKTALVLELLDFLERLAPFSTPELTLKDTQPRFIKPQGVKG
ncbi:MAG: nitrous oxide reductase family maturation protein NosD [Rhodoferax sp.]|uniref:nitrous oxide reductase family maturation protein NosD n=1 Tax=Rhodoferax sp. TaxID=50421 RepID=UPI003018D77E